MPPPTDAVAPSHVRVERREHVALVTINRPKVLNALDEVAHAQLAAAWDELAVDETVWVVILRGAGESAFCVGGDLRAARARTAAGTSPPKRVGGFGGLTERFDYPKPVIAAVHGWCLGGGFELALACDPLTEQQRASADRKEGLAAFAERRSPHWTGR